MDKKLVMLTILDGYGITDTVKGNAIMAANKPNLDYLFKEYPNTLLDASGEAVGLPMGQMGNSEVGHMNIGAGRIVYQSLTRVNIAVRNDELVKNPAIAKAINNAIKNNGKLHIMGLLSDGGVHSHIDHFVYLMEKASQAGVKEIVVHAFLDGRDVPPKSAEEYLRVIDNKCKELGNCKIGVVSGRYYAMDRDKNWARQQLAYDALVYNQAPVKELYAGLKESYDQGVTDEFVVPYLANTDSNINDGDSVIHANFRPDRAIQLCVGLSNLEKTGFKGKKFENLTLSTMMHYSDDVIANVAFDVQELTDTYGEVIAAHNMTQLRIAETEKYAHVTYFFDGGVEKDIPGADRILVPSPKVATFDMKPEMSAYEVKDKVVEAILSKKYDTIILNFANCDMVGHTCNWDATIKAVETVDACVGEIYKAVKSVDGILLITADHGNADKLIDENDQPFSAHSTNPVPFIVCKKGYELRNGGNLGDIAPTMLELLNVEKSKYMTGNSLIKK